MSSINIGYVGYQVYLFFTHLNTGSIGAISWSHTLDMLAWIGVGLTAVFFVLFVFFYFKAEYETEHGLEMREEEEILLMNVEQMEPRNERWDQAVALVNSQSAGDWRRAILEADILLHEMLTDRGFPGEDVGEQLKGASRAHFRTLDMAWEAHRIRNSIAHEGETFPLDQRAALAAIDRYRNVFEEFGYI